MRSVVAMVVFACSVFAGCDARADADCTALTNGVAFGVYDTLAAAPDDSTGSVSVVCAYVGGRTARVSYSVSLS
ncbi:MAG TPA: spore coat protein U domain-containing protein, partial [Pseudomonadales bacterium]|nr:spore coat protein U domain-containing protein [Pseudomonadales bacterium]